MEISLYQKLTQIKRDTIYSIISVDYKDRTFTLIDDETEFTIDLDITRFYDFLKQERYLQNERMERSFIDGLSPILIIEELSVDEFLEQNKNETYLSELLAEYLSRINQKEFKRILSTSLTIETIKNL